ncbi:efflux RND transporter periplasmic adaptor subunit [Lujinxingia litoralis]|nr:efflux RND transporter periplasmic adaptor subunit [Lujinxingia litoralis]
MKRWGVALGCLALLGGGACRGDSAEGEHGDHAHASEQGAQDEAQEYVCPMHPQVRQDGPGTCPICFMDLVPSGSDGGDSDIPSVRLSEGSRRLAQVANANVEAGALVDTFEVFGKIEVSEKSEVDLSAWVGGRIERLYVNARGEEVKRGQRIARIYSPQLLTAQQTLLQARRNLEAAQASGSVPRERAAQASFAAVREELRLLGMGARQIDAVLSEGSARKTVDVFATASGTVRERLVSVGDYVTTGEPLVSLAALDTVWAQLEIFEQDISRVSVGQPANVRIPALGDHIVEARVDFLAPEIEPERRVMLARVALPNDEGRLRPGMYLSAELERRVGDEHLLSIPREAVLWTGSRSMVYRWDTSLEPPAYVPERIEIGERLGDRVIVRDGLKAGDVVAARGAFRIDASLQIKGGPSMMSELTDTSPVEVAPEGTRFDPAVDAERLPEGVWFCDMGTTHYAQHGSGECPVCGMFLVEKTGDEDAPTEDATHDHEHHHDHEPTSPVEVVPEGTRFDPAIDPERLPEGAWFCDMGTTHYAQHASGECPVCGMSLVEKTGGDSASAKEANHGHNHEQSEGHHGH